jgi:acyl transferase domain-containing protein/SAM-dependent methyltransferase/acyl carrier protein
VGSAVAIARLYDYAREQGLPADKMDVTGKAHNPENSEFVAEFLAVLRQNPALFQLPNNSRLQVTVRSNRTGEALTDDFIMEDMTIMMLAACCDWYGLLTRVAEDMKASARPSHHLVIFGMNDSVPLSPFNKQRLKISKFKAHTLISEISDTPKTPEASEIPITTRTERVSTGSFEFPDSAIAIVGVSCRLPGADNLEKLWDFISKGGDTHQELPDDRIDPSKSFRASQDRSSSIESKRYFGNFLDDIKRFDNSAFGINAKEATNLDPQQRMLLELSYEALESSGYLASHTRGDPVGCFIGGSLNEYIENTTSHVPSAYTATGTIRAFLCGRLSHYYGWTAPAEVIDTACSSSLVAINRACSAILMGECEMALAGGVSALTGMNNFLDLGKAGFLSPTGQCKPFDILADGYCRAEGAGLVVLKKLSKAMSVGDEIFGVIPSIATNQGGTSSTLTVPSFLALSSLYQNIVRKAGLQPSQISYVEAHGTGTQAGDPIEMESIRSVFGDTNRSVPLSIGSIKGNIGHCESAAGVAGLLKVLAMMKYGGIPRQVNHNQLNPKIPSIKSDGMEINKKLRSWDVPLRAALVNSYGAAGSNCALVCCEMPQGLGRVSQSRVSPSREISFPIIISATSRASLIANSRAIANHLSKNQSHTDAADIAFTLNQRRKRHRYCFDTTTADISVLTSVEAPAFEYPNESKPVVLVLSGQYDTKVALPHGIYDIYPAFRSYIDACDSEIVALGYQSILTTVFQTTPISSAVSLQCSIFAMQYACASCWIDSGLEPKSIIGHSLGEIVALAVSGALSLSDCLRLVAFRAHLIDTKWGSEKGVMLAIHSSPNQVQKLASKLASRAVSSSHYSALEIACYNASSSTIAVGTAALIDAAETILSTDPDFRGIKFQRLSTSHAFHSPFTQPILPELERFAKTLTWNRPVIPLETCTPGAEGSPYEGYWNPSRHAREPVYFLDAVQRLERRLGSCIWVEAGFDTPIIPMIKRACSNTNTHTFQSVRTNVTEKPWDCISTVVSDLWRCGISLSHWTFLGADIRQFKQVWLPPYQFQKNSYWVENVDRAMEEHQKLLNSAPIVEPSREVSSPKLVSRKTQFDPNPQVIEFSVNTTSERFQKIAKGHAVLQQPLCPAPMHLECTTMAIQALIGYVDAQNLVFEELNFPSALGLDPAREVDLSLEELVPKKSWRFKVHSTVAGSPRTSQIHCVGTASLGRNVDLATYGRLVESSINRVDTCQTVERLMKKRAYGLFSKVMHYAPFMQGISSIALEENEAVATVNVPENQPGREGSAVWRRFDTAHIDNFISVVGLLLNSSDIASSEEVLIASGIESVVLTSACQADPPREWLVYAKYMATEGTQPVGDVFVCSSKREVVAIMTGVQFARVDISKLKKSLMSANGGVPSSQVERPEEVKFPSPHEEHLSSSSSKSSGVPTPLEDSVDTGIREVISNYTGLNVADIPQDVVLVELGMDSLSSIEFVAELHSNFGIEVKSEELGDLTLDDLTRRLAGNVSTEAVNIHVNIGGPRPNTTLPVPSNSHFEDSSPMAPSPALGSMSKEPAREFHREGTSSDNPFDALLQTDQLFEEAAKQRGYSGYHSKVFSLEKDLTLAYILEAFRALGVDLLSLSPGSVISPLSNIPKHDKLVTRLWEILQGHDMVKKQTSILTRARARPSISPSKEIYENLVSQFPQYLPEANLIKLAGDNLARCLRGEQDPLALLFGSPASSKIMEEYYSNSPMVSTLTDQLVTLVLTILQNRTTKEPKPIRILEVGAGTGGTTKRLAENLQAASISCEYTFTDISGRMVSKAKGSFSQYHWMRFEIFDLEKEVHDSFRDRFDIVIGTNCVHATSSRVASCHRIWETLNENGVAILSEGTQPLDWFDICFGLLDGWWVAEEGKEYPLQPASKWIEVLQAAGFPSTSFSRGPTEEAFTQQLLVGCKQNWPVPPSPEPAPVPSLTQNQSDSYKLETMVYKEVSGVQIHADVYVPRLIRASPLPIGMHFPPHLDLITDRNA